ncbi:MAG: hypothetical protein SYC29_14925 [Planctomycetota bacterium]|nr:hypothetical protein [Planctomycetota bacterium]
MLNVRSICRFGFGAVVLLAAVSGAPAQSGERAPTDAGGLGRSGGVERSGGLERALALLERMDEITLSVEYQDERVVNVIGNLNAVSPIPIAADWDALAGMGLDERDRVTLRLQRADLSTVLAALAFQLGDEFGRPTIEIHAGRIVLTTLGATVEMSLTDVYDVRDLLRDSAVLEELRRRRPAPAGAEPIPDDDDDDDDASAVGAKTGAAAGNDEDLDADAEEDETPDDEKAPEASGPFELPLPDFEEMSEAMPARPLTPGEELLSLIAEHVDPEAWIEYGGSRARISERDGVLFVTAPPTTHRKFRDALRRLRRTTPSAVLIEAAIVDLPCETFARLNRRYDAAGRALGRALLAADEAAPLWQAMSAVALGDTLVAESERAGVAVSLHLSPRFDPETGILRLEIDVESTEGEDRRSVATTATIPFRQGGATIELPAATAGESVRLLVLIPRRR